MMLPIYALLFVALAALVAFALYMAPTVLGPILGGIRDGLRDAVWSWIDLLDSTQVQKYYQQREPRGPKSSAVRRFERRHGEGIGSVAKFLVRKLDEHDARKGK